MDRGLPLLLAWFGTAVLTGCLFAWLLREDPAPLRPVDRPPGGARAAEGPALRSAAAPGRPDPSMVVGGGMSAVPGAGVPGTAASPVTPVFPMPRTDGWLDVEVVTADGVAVPGGEVYALPAGESGTDDGAVPPHTCIEDGRARLPVLEGRYDVGVVAMPSQRLVLDQDVRAGRGTHVRVELPARGDVTALLADAPTPRPGAETRVYVSLWAAQDGPRYWYPGRHEAWGRAQMRPVGVGRTRVGSVAQGERAEPAVFVRDLVKDPKNASLVHEEPCGHLVATWTPHLVGPGDTVRVTLHPAARLELQVRLGTGVWPAGAPAATRFRLEQTLGEEAVSWTGTWTSTSPRGMSAELNGVAGTARLSWEGGNVLPGSLEGLVLRRDRPTRAEVALAYAGPRVSEGGDVPVQIHWPADARDEDAVELVGVAPDAQGTPEVLQESFSFDARVAHDGPEPRVLPPRFHHGGTVWAFGPERDWVGRPLPVRRGDVLDVRLERGGRVLVVLSRRYPESAGTLTLRRRDGAPFVASWPDADGEVRLESRLVMGLCLGPMLPGPQAFELRLAGRLIGEVTAQVVAGRTVPLVLGD